MLHNSFLHNAFEVNTDSALIHADWEHFAFIHEQRYGLAIDYVKETVHGEAYDNAIMTMIAGDTGFFVQSKNFPAAFYGETRKAEVREISEAEVNEITWEAIALYRSGEVQSLTCIYNERHPPDVFFGYCIDSPNGHNYYESLGFLRSQAPIHLRVNIDSQQEENIIGNRKGTVIYQRCSDGRHILLKAPGKLQAFPLLDGFLD